ncbi:hypothetical protein LCGC14_2454110 [marine sediment metagenome]|uniref:Uncharacterized protein n=1 Tax=marine sediment metagenome TaxID=412755 RepID=A0A0F9E921_9ZZZZ
MQFILTLTRTTKHTYRFDNPDEDSDLRTVYVQQTAFPNGAPEKITVTVEAN